jgi:hypothetical protein
MRRVSGFFQLVVEKNGGFVLHTGINFAETGFRQGCVGVPNDG